MLCFREGGGGIETSAHYVMKAVTSCIKCENLHVNMLHVNILFKVNVQF